MTETECPECGHELSFPPRSFEINLWFIGTVGVTFYDTEDRSEPGSCWWCASADETTERAKLCNDAYLQGEADGYHDALDGII